MAITKDTPIEDLKGIEAVEEVLMMRGVGCTRCAGCEDVQFGTLGEIAEKNGLKVNELVREINAAIDAAEEE